MQILECYNWSTTSSLVRFSIWSFRVLAFLHLDLCPRLIQVLPLPMSIMDSCLGNIVTLEIAWCSDLKEIFPFYYSGAESSDKQRESTYEVELSSLKHIHLNELPRLRSICGGNARLAAPSLETIKIRGCWSLRRLPASTGSGARRWSATAGRNGGTIWSGMCHKSITILPLL